MMMTFSPQPHRASTASGDPETASAGVQAVFSLVQRSNHATAFAGWVVATGAMGLVIEARSIQTAARTTFGVPVVAALVPVLAAAAYVVALLARAGSDISAAYDAFYRFIATTPTDAPDFTAAAWHELRLVTAAARRREARTRRALKWAYAAGIAFVLWSAIVMALASGL